MGKGLPDFLSRLPRGRFILLPVVWGVVGVGFWVGVLCFAIWEFIYCVGGVLDVQ